MRPHQLRILLHHTLCQFPRLPQEIVVGQIFRKRQFTQPTLLGTKQRPGAAEFEVGLGDFKPIRGRFHDPEFFHALLGFAVGQQNAITLASPTADPTT